MRDVSKWTDPGMSNLHALSMDVTSDESVATAVNTVIAEEGQVDIVINNAGFGLAGCLETVALSEAKVIIQNFTASK